MNIPILPAPIARAMEFEKGETIEWVIADQFTLLLKRHEKRRSLLANQKKR